MKLTVAHLKRTLTPGTKLRITNYIHPERGNRDTVVTEKTNTVNLVTWARWRPGEIVHSHMSWPKAHDLRAGETDNIFHIDSNGTAFMTIEVIGDDHPEARHWPDTVRALSEENAHHA